LGKYFPLSFRTPSHIFYIYVILSSSIFSVAPF